jgi:hypothetical protein
MAQDNCDGMAGFTNAALADYAVEIQFFDTADRPEAHVTLPLVHFFNQNDMMGTSPSLGRWLK